MTFARLVTSAAAFGCFTPALRPRDKCLPAGIDHGAVAEGSEQPAQPRWLDTGECRELGARREGSAAREVPRSGGEPFQSVGAQREPVKYTRADSCIK